MESQNDLALDDVNYSTDKTLKDSIIGLINSYEMDSTSSDGYDDKSENFDEFKGNYLDDDDELKVESSNDRDRDEIHNVLKAVTNDTEEDSLNFKRTPMDDSTIYENEKLISGDGMDGKIEEVNMKR